VSIGAPIGSAIGSAMGTATGVAAGGQGGAPDPGNTILQEDALGSLLQEDARYILQEG
jgi:hypothetical protein